MPRKSKVIEVEPEPEQEIEASEPEQETEVEGLQKIGEVKTAIKPKTNINRKTIRKLKTS